MTKERREIYDIIKNNKRNEKIRYETRKKKKRQKRKYNEINTLYTYIYINVFLSIL